MLGTSKSVWGFDPRSIPGCSLWLDAADTTTVVQSSGSISQWNDKSASALTATAVNNPTIVVNVQNGLPGVSLNGSNQYFNLGNNLNMLTNQLYIFVVCKFNSTADGAIIGKSLLGGGVGRYSLLRIGGILNPLVQGTGGGNDSGVNSDTNTSPRILNMIWDRNTIVLYQNGSSVFSVGLSEPSSVTNNNSLLIGAYQNGSGGTPPAANLYMNGFIHEILLYFTPTSSPLSTSQRQQIEGYLAHKWGLTASYSQTVPLTIPGCQLWLDGRDRSSMTFSGSTITQWNDKSGNGYNATIAPDRVGAIYSTDYNAVNFASSTTGYITNYSAAPTNETMFVVGNNPSPSGANNIIIGGVSGARSLGLGYSNPNGTGTIGNLNTQVAWLASVGGYTTGTTALVRSQFTPSSNSVSFNGGSTGTGGAPGFTAGRVTYLGVDATNGYYHYNGYMMEALFYNRILTTTEIQTIETYLAKKWGIGSSSMIPSTHPFSNIPPYLRLFKPNDIPGCQLWLDAADASTVTVTNGTVTNVMNKGNTGITLSNASGFTYDSTNMAFSNATSNASFNLGKNSTYTQTQPGTLFAVAAFSSAVSNPYIIDSRSTQVDVGRFAYSIIRNAANTANVAYAFAGSLVSPDFGLRIQSDIPPNIRTLHTLLMNSTSSDVRINGITQTWSQNPGTNSMTGITVANRYSDDNSWVGTINEILLFNRGLTLAERQQIEWYLANKWGIFSTSPVSTPLTISGSGIWLDGSDTSSMTFSSGAITQWRDKSGSSNHFGLTRGTATSILDNGRSVVNFGEATVMTSTNSISFTTSSAFFIVSKMTSTNGAQDLLGFPSFGNGFALRFFSSILYSGNGDDLSLGNYYVNGNFNPSYPSTTYYNTYSLISTLVPSRGGTTVISLSDNWLLEGHAQRFFIGNIAEFIFYPGGVSNIQRQKIEGYLANKWGLTLPAPTVHPYDKYPPASVDNIIIFATGGTITTSGSYKIHTFTTVGTTTFTLTSPTSITAQVLVLGGGGGGGSWQGGGGGAGGAVFNGSFTITSGTYNVVVGDGGAGDASTGAGYSTGGFIGGNSSFNGIVGQGGGGGGTYIGPSAGTSGGCGGGSAYISAGAAGTQGFAGGTSLGEAGGGGGMGSAGQNGGPGTGGNGFTYTIANTAYLVAGGGGAGQNSAGGTGGGGGGGNDGTPKNGYPGTTNKGGGGGGGGRGGSGGKGGSGIVIIAYKT